MSPISGQAPSAATPVEAGLVGLTGLVVAVGVPLGVHHDPRAGADPPAATVIRLGGRAVTCDEAATVVWSRALAAPRERDLRALAAPLGGDGVALLLNCGLLARPETEGIGLALIPLGIAMGNSADTPEIFNIRVTEGRPLGLDALLFEVWARSHGGRSLAQVCTELSAEVGIGRDAIAEHVLSRCADLLGVAFFLDRTEAAQ